MKMSLPIQPYLSAMNRYDLSESEPASYVPSAEMPFSEVLQAELANGQRVIRAEQILAELDGSTDWDFTDASDTYTTGSSSQTPQNVQGILDKISQVARSYGVDENLVREVVRAESNFNPNAVSRAGAKGLMQLMDATAKSLHVRNVYNPDDNLAGGTKYLRGLLDRYDGNVKVALAAYNAGPGRISRLGIDTDDELEQKYELLPQETQRYVDKIMKRLEPGGTS
ncbi:lytic transglycosylase domain-containing protein [Brevibacillus borstelensis]|jgi:soluble lytic murein transglycosylase-like protein|uniref:lytic transglycosylase domain-containing protein n=1 Tax=Brevibacillus borstelensis TaxID=45462 RepID=UPI001562CA96|nr:lytic transglycosylase domain-containing protein [Brevibacillus borstelensis]MBE5397791.1 lytic transglycosylase domain-containing protein [Brevibacillus borstelensis]MED1874915.1 lytic transglycosylase domain-containing protein [Brevibacillus borstelensis]